MHRSGRGRDYPLFTRRRDPLYQDPASYRAEGREQERVRAMETTYRYTRGMDQVAETTYLGANGMMMVHTDHGNGNHELYLKNGDDSLSLTGLTSDKAYEYIDRFTR